MWGRVWGYPKTRLPRAIVLEKRFERSHKDTQMSEANLCRSKPEVCGRGREKVEYIFEGL